MDSYKKMRLFILLPLESEVTKPLDFRDGRNLVEDVKQRLGKEKKTSKCRSKDVVSSSAASKSNKLLVSALEVEIKDSEPKETNK